jgi:hypothetical protein
MPRLAAPLSARLSPRARKLCALGVLLFVFALAVYVVGSLVGYVMATGALAALCLAVTVAHRRGIASSPLVEAGAKALLLSVATLAGWLLARVSRVLVLALVLVAVTGLGSGAIGSLVKILAVLAFAWLLLMFVAERTGRSPDDGWF